LVVEKFAPVLGALRVGGSLVGKEQRTLFSQYATVMLAVPTVWIGVGCPVQIDTAGRDARKERAE
jgi:hypothetical protein